MDGVSISIMIRRIFIANEITCINKQDRYNIHERITYIGGKNADGGRWRITQLEAIQGIKSGKWSFYVASGGQKVDVIVSTSRAGFEYIKTRNDGEEPNNLLSLREGPLLF